LKHAEILSPSSERHDRFRKLNIYQRAGVPEYWIVEPDSNTMTAYILENGRYFVTVYADENTVPVSVLEGFMVNLQEVFEG